tara:strand:+ start:366 stop:476 length:111 start_codon:yes stop_codon:yes gene_type:complete
MDIFGGAKVDFKGTPEQQMQSVQSEYGTRGKIKTII